MIYILIPVFKRLEHTKNFLKSLEPIASSYTVIIGDDEYPKFSHSILAKPNVRIVKGNGALFWGGSINLCIHDLFSNYSVKNNDIIIFANNDVILDNACFEKINSYIKKAPSSIYHPRVFNSGKKEISAGAIVKSWFPYITIHPKNFKKELLQIHMATARCLCMTGKTILLMKSIHPDLPHYGGDNEFSLRALREHNIKTHLVRDAKCYVDEKTTGISTKNAPSLKDFLKTFSNIKSPNNVKYRYTLVSSCHNKFYSKLITANMTLITFIK